MIPIGMQEMNAVFGVTDALEISREAIQVELLPEGAGAVERLANGRVRIVLPADRPLADWLPELRRRLEGLGRPPEARP